MTSSVARAANNLPNFIVERCRTFRELHRSGCFVIPNPWDLGSARLLVQLGFPALATTSSGFAWSLGRPDNGVSLQEALTHFRTIAENVTGAGEW
jgi:2-methylisocitrate lyase-like PEP mutase family enzyme